MTETIAHNNQAKHVDEFVQLFMTNEPQAQQKPPLSKFELKRAERPRPQSDLKVKVSGGDDRAAVVKSLPDIKSPPRGRQS